MGSKEIAIVGCIFSTMLLLVSCVPNTMKPSNEAKMGNKVVNDSKCLSESHFYVGGSVAYGSGGGGGYGSGGGGGFGTGGGGSGFGSGGGGGGFGSGGGGGEGGGEGSGFGGGSGSGGEGGGYGGGNGGGEGGGEGGGFGGGGGGLDTVNPSKDTSLHGGGNRKYGGHNTFAVPQAKP